MFGLERLNKLRKKFGTPSVTDPVTGAELQDDLGRELLDGTPMQPPVGYKRQPTMVEHIREMVRSERLAAEAAAAGFETFEEADDFNIADEDGEMPSSPHENEFDPPVQELLAEGKAAKEKREREEAAAKRRKELEDDDEAERAYRRKMRERDNNK